MTLGRNDKGFTLIELLIVVVILGVLSAIAVPIYLTQQDKAKDAAVATQLTQAKTAIALAVTEGSPVSTMTTASLATLASYSASSDIVVAMTLTEEDENAFTLTGEWNPGNVANAGTNKYIITESTSATPE